uniref:BORCS6 domain-containing protein n=1 Tax=Rhabditophanes sp. KR3021 TaxID=114890 RepID=A0AC35TYI1_9BILA
MDSNTQATGVAFDPSDDIKTIKVVEADVRTLTDEVDTLLRSLRGTMRGITDLTSEGMEVFTGCLMNTCSSAESATKQHFSIMAKMEELTLKMSKIDETHAKVKEVKELVDIVYKHLQVTPQ